MRFEQAHIDISFISTSDTRPLEGCQGLGIKMKRFRSRFSSSWRDSAKSDSMVPIPDMCTVVALAGVGFIQCHWHERMRRFWFPYMTPHADYCRLSKPTAR